MCAKEGRRSLLRRKEGFVRLRGRPGVEVGGRRWIADDKTQVTSCTSSQSKRSDSPKASAGSCQRMSAITSSILIQTVQHQVEPLLLYGCVGVLDVYRSGTSGSTNQHQSSLTPKGTFGVRLDMEILLRHTRGDQALGQLLEDTLRRVQEGDSTQTQVEHRVKQPPHVPWPGTKPSGLAKPPDPNLPRQSASLPLFLGTVSLCHWPTCGSCILNPSVSLDRRKRTIYVHGKA